MKNYFFLIAIVSCLYCKGLYAVNYYVSGSVIASDANSGTSILTPWRSISKLNTANLLPGDSVLFERGWTYRGQINARAGAPGNPVCYSAYGTGNKPVISGAILVSNLGWSIYQGNINEKNFVIMPSMADAEPPNLFINGQLMIPARYPATGFLTADDVYGQNPGSNCCEYSYSLQHSFLSSTFTNDSDLVGAHITGYSPYGVSSRMINNYNHTTGTLDFDTLRGIGFINHKHYFLSRKLNLLDAAGEWFYDDVQNKLYVWKYDGSPVTSADMIEYSYYDYGIDDWQIPYITVKNLEFRYQQIAGIHIIRSTGVEIADNRFHQIKYGIHGWGSSITSLTGTIVRNNLFDNIHRVGINLNNYIDSALVTDNILHNIGLHNGLMQSGNADQWSNYGYWEYGKGIEFNGTNSIISLNRIDSTGRQAIAAGGADVLIRNNVIDWPCLNYNDCGGIMPLSNSVVDGNIIRNSIGYFSNSPAYSGYGARGIYPDFRTGDVIINNTIVNTVTGIGLTNSKNEIVESNTVYNSSYTQFRMNRKTAGQLSNTIRKNIFFGLTAEQNSFSWDNQVSGPDNNSVADSNYYWNPYSYYPLVKYRSDGTLPEVWYDLEQWQITGKDMNSKKEFVFKNIPYIITDTTGVNFIINGNFNSGTSGWNNTGNMVVSTTPGQLDTTSASITYNGVYAGTFSQDIIQTFTPDSFYLISFSLKGALNAHGEPVEVKLVETANTSEQHFYRVFKNETMRKEYLSVFKAENSNALTLRFIAPNGTYYLDNINIYPVSVTWLNPQNVFPIFINETSSPMVVNLPPCNYLDLDSNLVGPSITLPPFSSQILVLVNDSCLLTSIVKPTLAKNTFNIYPNPSSSDATVEFFVNEKAGVHLSIHDLEGKQVLTLIDTQLIKGNYSVSFNSSMLKPGTYFVLYREGKERSSKRLVVVR